jgi:hypothetical protein
MLVHAIVATRKILIECVLIVYKTSYKFLATIRVSYLSYTNIDCDFLTGTRCFRKKPDAPHKNAAGSDTRENIELPSLLSNNSMIILHS